MLTYNYGTADSQILRGVSYPGTVYTKEYNPPIEEFSILSTLIPKPDLKESFKGLPGPSILICTSGSGFVEGENGERLETGLGSIFWVPAGESVTLTASLSDFGVYRAFCILEGSKL